MKTVSPNVRLRCASARQADFVSEGYVDPPPLRYGVTSPREPLRDESSFCDHTGYYTLPEPYPVFHVTALTPRQRGFAGLLRSERCGRMCP